MLKIGHRGASAHAPENTLASFRKAQELNVDMVELDVRVTKDKYLVVVHDNKLHRLTKEYMRLDHLTLEQVKKLKVKNTEEIPTLAEVLDVLDSNIGINIDLKVTGEAILVVQTLRDYKVDFEKTMISSVHPSELRLIKELEPKIITALIFRSANASNFWLMMDGVALLFWPITQYYISWLVEHAHADYLSVNHRLLNKRNVELFKKRQIKICAWTVNSHKKINYLKQLGIDGIITNYPDRL